MIDGLHLIDSYRQRIGAPGQLVVSDSGRHRPEIAALLADCPSVPCLELSDALFRRLSPVQTPTGILGVIPIPEYRPRPEVPEPCVILEDVQDPGNLGSILRSTAAAGIRQVYLSAQCADLWSPKVLRAGMGAHFHLECYTGMDLAEFAATFPGPADRHPSPRPPVDLRRRSQGRHRPDLRQRGRGPVPGAAGRRQLRGRDSDAGSDGVTEYRCRCRRVPVRAGASAKISRLMEQTHFGFETVPAADKADRVRAVFDSVAPNYDLMNDLMSGGLHRLWKRFALGRTGLRPGDVALDVAGGTADLSAGMARQVGSSGFVCHTDINREMLEAGRGRLVDAGLFANVHTLQANAERLPFASDSFHCVTIGFGLRNCTDKPAALREMARVLRPGGRLLVLEFSKPAIKLIEPLYDLYSFRILPWLGEIIARDAASYRYLAESIRMHPDQESLRGLMTAAGPGGCPVPQPEWRHRGAAHRLPVLSSRGFFLLRHLPAHRVADQSRHRPVLDGAGHGGRPRRQGPGRPA